jgi:microcystin degradation protein MlrC
MKKKILIGSILCETNSFSPSPGTEADFTIDRGDAMLDACPVVPIFEAAGFGVVPTIRAHALPSGPVTAATYEALRAPILTAAAEHKDELAGVWLDLHGAMEVESLGSGELGFLQGVRSILGPAIPIAVPMDFHASLPDEIVDACDIITAYKTAPHEDYIDTQKRAGDLLLARLQGRVEPRLLMIRIPAIVDGNFVLTGISPQKEIMAYIAEQETGDILSIAFFACQPWVNTPYNSATVFVTYQGDATAAEDVARTIAGMYWDAKADFSYYGELLRPDVALARTIEKPDDVFFLSDSGDNPTAGAAGDSIFMLSKIAATGMRDVLLVPIIDPVFAGYCSDLAVGSNVSAKLGGQATGTGEQFQIDGKLLHKGPVQDYQDGRDLCRAVLVEHEGMHVLVAEARCAFVSPAVFAHFGIDYRDYRVIVFKLGYLFPDLQPLPDHSIYILSPGATSTVLEEMNFDNVRHPMWPFDKAFEFEPVVVKAGR